MAFVIDARTVQARPSGIGTYVEELIGRVPALAPEERFRLWTHPSRPRPAPAANVAERIVDASTGGVRTLLCPTVLDRLAPGDVIHLPHNLLGLGIRCASVVTIHDLMWLEQPELVDGRPLVRRLRQHYYQRGTRWAIDKATRILTVSSATADRIASLAPAAKRRVRVTHLAPRAAFVPAAAATRGSPPYYVVVGRNEPYKAHEIALQAFAAAALPGDELVLVQHHARGRGLQAVAEDLGIGKSVRWLPGVSLAELVALLQGAEALLQPSLVEGFGLPALEALACGCPVVASDAPALVEVLGGAGLHAPTGSAAGLAAAMRRLRDGALRAELCERGLERARAFSWDETARATLAVYREALEEGPATRG